MFAFIFVDWNGNAFIGISGLPHDASVVYLEPALQGMSLLFFAGQAEMAAEKRRFARLRKPERT
jgi:hypothetical protein